jgi:anti-sigma regulatory factor (Ser/Thr protein kinase)
VAFAHFPLRALCPYDARVVPAAVLADAYRTHPELLNGSKSEPCPQFVDPRAFVCQLDGEQELPEPEVPASHLAFEGDLTGLRLFVVDQASRAGMAPQRLDELEWVANEIATNVLSHADGVAVVRTWSGAEEFVCEISDRGPGLDDPLVGYLPPSPDDESPSGLWLAHQLCNRVDVRSSPSGLTARLHVSRQPAAP